MSMLGDPSLRFEALSNLVDNALKFTSPGCAAAGWAHRRPISSDARRPVWAARLKSVWSRRPVQVDRSGASLGGYMPREAPMGRRAKHAALEVLVSFEPARIAAECLARAYELILPIRRRPTRSDGHEDAIRRAVGSRDQRARQRGEHG